jgi:hypothetical protein
MKIVRGFKPGTDEKRVYLVPTIASHADIMREVPEAFGGKTEEEWPCRVVSCGQITIDTVPVLRCLPDESRKDSDYILSFDKRLDRAVYALSLRDHPQKATYPINARIELDEELLRNKW